MMKIYCVEWWDEYHSRYWQEYYLNVLRAASRVQMLVDDVTGSNPDLSTIFVEDEGSPFPSV